MFKCINQLRLFSIYVYLLFSFQNLFSQEYTKCSVYQYINEDSLKIHLAKVMTFNNSGQILTERVLDFYTAKYWGTKSYESFYTYKEGKLKKMVAIDQFKNKTKVYYRFKDTLLRKETHYKAEMNEIMKPFVRKGYGRKNGCLVNDDDFIRFRFWVMNGKIKYYYTPNGIIRLEYRKSSGFFCHYGYAKEYDSIGRIIKYYNLYDKFINGEKSYKYTEQGFISTEIFYSSHNAPMYKIDSLGNIPNEIVTHTFNKDKTEEAVTIMSEHGDFWGRELILYDKKGNILKRLQYDNVNQLSLTTIFKYDYNL